MIRVLIVEDSPTTSMILQTLLNSDPEIEVVGQAVDGQSAIDMVCRLKPDLITMDVNMPVMDGITATRRIMAQQPTPILIVTAQTDNADLNVVFEAMQAGALDVMAKPPGFNREPLEWETEFIEKVKSLAVCRLSVQIKENAND